MSIKWGRFFENFGEILEKILAEPGMGVMAKMNPTVRTELRQEKSCVTSIVSVYTNGRTVQSGTAHWSASKPDRLSQGKVQGQKLPILCRNYPLFLSWICRVLSASTIAYFIHGGDCWKFSDFG